ncbi:hypothetical protein ILP86_19460 [Microbacterium sp. R1]|uniref:hypothetical protein n=1 Tax=Microbacterium sp. R1 TaxID=322686 RepID=UPI00187D21EA|nr:hypothetical protein [Microbacterium sp. R1]MBE7956487.1 hypothetical protein [Microbacterium sp. R1]
MSNPRTLSRIKDFILKMPHDKKAPAPKKVPAPPKPKGSNDPRLKGYNPKSTKPSGHGGPSFSAVGKQRVAFIQAARCFDEYLKRVYGSNMTISQFERILLEVRGRPELRPMLFIEPEAIKLHVEYCAAKKRSEEEEATFKQTFATPSVAIAADITSIEDLFSIPK